MVVNPTQTAAEITEIPAIIGHQLDQGLEQYWDVGHQLRDTNLKGFVTCARGTSDHAAKFFKYLMETRTGLPVASIGPSVASIYKAHLKLTDFAAISFSQSGGSPDILALQKATKKGGAKAIAVLNVTDSPLGLDAEIILPTYSGPEKGVAATKSFIGMLITSLGMLAGYSNDRSILLTLQKLPDLAKKSLSHDMSTAIESISNANSLFCIGRGLSYAIACEASLKLKELCLLHAEAYSAAEVLHGPAAIAHEGFVALFLESSGLESDSMETARRNLKSRGATVISLGLVDGISYYLNSDKEKEFLSPILQSISFYFFVEELARKLGQNPDNPLGLQKVTKTL